MAIDITMDDGDDSKEELKRKLQLIRDEYDDKLEYEPGFWRKAWNETKKQGHVFLVWLGNELKQIWERGGREVVFFGALGGLALWLIPGAGPVIGALAPLVLAKIFYSAFGME